MSLAERIVALVLLVGLTAAAASFAGSAAAGPVSDRLVPAPVDIHTACRSSSTVTDGDVAPRVPCDPEDLAGDGYGGERHG